MADAAPALVSAPVAELRVHGTDEPDPLTLAQRAGYEAPPPDPQAEDDAKVQMSRTLDHSGILCLNLLVLRSLQLYQGAKATPACIPWHYWSLHITSSCSTAC